MDKQVQKLVSQLKLEINPEGGYSSETFRSSDMVDTPTGPRCKMTCSKNLLAEGEVWRLHRIQSDRMIAYNKGGGCVTVVTLEEGVGVKLTVLGNEEENEMQCVVKSGVWMGCYVNQGSVYGLLSITDSPGFDLKDLEKGSSFHLKHRFPSATEVITKLAWGSKDEGTKEGKRGRERIRTVQEPSDFRSDRYEKPRQLLNSLALLLAMFYFNYKSRAAGDLDSHGALALAMGGSFLAFEVFAFLQVRDLITVWPHPGFWRLVFGAGAFYALLLVAMFVLDFKRARFIFEAIFGDLGTWGEFTVKMQSVKADTMATCDVTPSSVFKQIFMAPWFLSHALGWMGKMMIFRDWNVCLYAALFFEFTELTFTYVVPEFEECWWDSVFLDTFGANLLGMWMGTAVNKWIVRYSRNRTKKKGDMAASVGAHLDWGGVQERSEIDRLISLSSPLTMSANFKWKIFSSPLRFLQVAALIGVMLFVEINTFLMMNTMGIPHDSVFNKLRLALMGFLSLPAAAEWYVYVEHTTRAGHDTARMGPACWLLVCICCLESCLFWKYFPHHFVSELDRLKLGIIPVPRDILFKHIVAISLFGLWFILRFMVIGDTVEEESLEEEDRVIVRKLMSQHDDLAKRRRQSVIKMIPKNLQWKVLKVEVIDLLMYAAFVPLFALCVNWKFD
mmetsp:Transcript_5285/g.10558  ORF Transcript_5285/g.10558 Transcript_5285/m.10558 type:complete len:672 (+) Transcript_5285:181-2196(+)